MRWTQKNRRALLLKIVTQTKREFAARGMTITHTEEEDGMTFYTDSGEVFRITYAELGSEGADDKPACYAVSQLRKGIYAHT